jgi:hypothetical protein
VAVRGDGGGGREREGEGGDNNEEKFLFKLACLATELHR